ncbi:ATP-dependent DNA ligase [Candidatus Dependentiae bacterium]|nr:ATP-dependent DNA ligase [Candidatus Dependentiae bacterium]
MKFSQVAATFAKLEAESSRITMMHELGKLLAASDTESIRPIVYMAMGTINPPYLPTQIGLAGKSVAKVIAELLAVDLAEVARWEKQYGDLGTVVLQHYHHTGSSALSVITVYDTLVAIAQTQGVGAQEKKQELLQQLLAKVSAEQACYIIRIIVGKLRLGFSAMTLIDALSWMLVGDKKARAVIENAYNLCADLGYIAFIAKRAGIAALEQVHIEVGIPIRLAAAERLPTAAAIMEKLGAAVAEPKVDGFRLQIHADLTKKDPVIRFFSRNLVDMSASFPDLVDAIAQLPVKTIIFEGEAIAYNPSTGEFVPFQETVRRKRKHDIADVATQLPLKVFAFDLLYLNGKLLLEESLVVRREQLKKVLAHHTERSTITAIQEIAVHDVATLERYFYECLEHGLEGVMVKRPDSPYQAGHRNFNWIKLKRQEHGHLEDTIDCVILGYYTGQGKRTGFGIGAFLVGVYNDKIDALQTIAKIGTGLTDEQWRELKSKLDAYAVAHKPALVQCDPALVPDGWVSPQIVVMVRADEITRSPIHTAGKTAHELGYALRFPRFMGYRPDKSMNDCTTVDEIKHLAKDQKVLRS